MVSIDSASLAPVVLLLIDPEIAFELAQDFGIAFHRVAGLRLGVDTITGTPRDGLLADQTEGETIGELVTKLLFFAALLGETLFCFGTAFAFVLGDLALHSLLFFCRLPSDNGCPSFSTSFRNS